MLQVHNAGNKLGRRCDMCSNYEKQLQGIQIQEAETRDQVSFLWGGGANLVSCCQPGELL